MYVTKKYMLNHCLGDTLHEIERIAREYQDDVKDYIHLKPSEMFTFISQELNYIPDPVNPTTGGRVELLQRPAITLKRGGGDCDDKTIFALAYFLSKGIKCGYSIVSESTKKSYHHIFPFMVYHDKITNKDVKIDYDATYAHNKIGTRKDWKKRKNFFIAG